MGNSLPKFRVPGFRAIRYWGSALVVCAGLLAMCGLSPATAYAGRSASGSGTKLGAKWTSAGHARRPRSVSGTTPSAQIASVPGKPIAGRLFAADSPWNEPLPANAPIDRSSSRLVAHFDAEAEQEMGAGTGPFVQTYSYTTPVYVVGRDQRAVRVAIDTDQTSAWVNSLQGASNNVPVPPRAQASPGTDSQITIFQPSTNRLWEYWHFRHEGDGWHARWGGAIDNVSGNPGYYSPLAWNGAMSIWGASGTSLPLVAGTMTLAELRSGEINHALAMSIPDPRAGVAAWPAQRSDGTGSAAELPEGAHLRLNPRLDIPAMHLPRIVEMMALAAQRYGIIVRDQTHADIGFFAEDPAPFGAKPHTPSDPYYGAFRDSNGTLDPVHGMPDAHALFDGMWPSTFFRYFPWRSLQVLKLSLHSTI